MKTEQSKPYLIKGIDLTDEQKAMLKFNGMSDPDFVIKHSFYFKDGKPCQDYGFYYPVITNPSYK